MAKYEQFFNETRKELDNSQKYLIGRIDECIKKSEVEQHYATKYFVWVSLLSFFVIICTAYWLITPLIERKNDKLETKIEEILIILKSKKE